MIHMADPLPVTAPARRRSGWRWAGGILGAFVVVAVTGSYLLWQWIQTPRRPTIDVSRVTVVRQVQQLARLETVMFAMDKIVAGSQESRFLPTFLAGDRLLLIAYGEVTAGVDLSRLGDNDVTISGNTITLRLPEFEVFTTRIDNERTRVYLRSTGLLSKVDPNLETEVRREAERQIRQAALDGGILAAAEKNGRTTLRAFIGALGFASVDIP